MNRATIVKLAGSTALLAMVAVGCKPSTRPATLSSVAPVPDRQAGKQAEKASAALVRQDAAAAVSFAEDAVTLAPRDAGYRMLLGRAYIAAGRFKSAEAVLVDALTLYPDNGQTELSLALTRIALGKWDSARELLADAKGKVGESDRGLALTLAGDKDGGLQALEGAARAEGADAKARQNLALGYALAGRWAESASTAAQDLSPDLVKTRMTEWARMSQPKDAWDQVAALMHVTPVEDGGMPTALALAPVQAPADPVALALAETAPAAPATPATAAPAPVVAAPVVTAPAAMAKAAPVAAPATEMAQAAPRVVPVSADVPPAPYIPDAAPPLIAAVAKPGRLLLARAAPAAFRQSADGRYVVQLGAFSSEAQVKNAWQETTRRVGRIAGLMPSRASFGTQRAGMVYRLSLAGFATRETAVNLCLQIRAAKGACFVRTAAGDAIASWARPNIQLAAR